MSEVLTLPELDIVRATLLRCEFRADDDKNDDSLGLMQVRFSPFNSWYRIDSFWEGSFLERTIPGAFKRTLNAHNSAKDPHSIKTLFNHGMDFHIGDKLLGDIVDAREEDDSPVTTVRLWDTSYNRDLLPGLRSGAYGASFMFRVVQDEWNNEPEPSEHNPDGLPERTLKEVRVFEAGPVTWPANPAATAGARSFSATDAFYEHLARRDARRVEELRSRLAALRHDAEPAEETPTDSAVRHSGGLSRAQRERLLNQPTIRRIAP